MAYIVKLTDVNVNVYFPPILPIMEELIKNASGSLTLFDEFIGSIRYSLQVDWRKENLIVIPRVGEVVTVTAKSEGRRVGIPVPLKTESVGEDTALFSGVQERS